VPNSNRKLTIQQRNVKGEKHRAKKAKKQMQARARGLPDTMKHIGESAHSLSALSPLSTGQPYHK